MQLLIENNLGIIKNWEVMSVIALINILPDYKGDYYGWMFVPDLVHYEDILRSIETHIGKNSYHNTVFNKPNGVYLVDDNGDVSENLINIRNDDDTFNYTSNYAEKFATFSVMYNFTDQIKGDEKNG